MKLKLNIKTAINIIAAILLITVIIITLIQNAELNTINTINEELIANIELKENEINQLTNENEGLNNNITLLNNDITHLRDTNNKLQEYNSALELKVQELKDVMEQVNVYLPKDFKSYMPYQVITDKSSKQWELRQIAYTNDNGIRYVDGLPMIAIGTGWGLWVGDKVLVTCANGNSFKAIVGDIKDDRHTDAERKTTMDNGCRCEFLVDVSKIDPTARKLGNMAVLDEYKGYVINIESAS